jgi:hypothetical protein
MRDLLYPQAFKHMPYGNAESLSSSRYLYDFQGVIMNRTNVPSAPGNCLKLLDNEVTNAFFNLLALLVDSSTPTP